MYMCDGLTTQNWKAYVELHPWQKPILSSQRTLATYGAMWNFPCPHQHVRWYCQHANLTHKTCAVISHDVFIEYLCTAE